MIAFGGGEAMIGNYCIMGMGTGKEALFRVSENLLEF